MRRSFRRDAEFSVPLPRSEAMAMFTPEGERAWAGDHGWDPEYPDPERTRGAGAVFVTAHQGRETCWVMVDDNSEQVRYARVTPGGLAGTVEVAVVSATSESTAVRVTYDLTAVREAAVAEMLAFEDRYDAEIASWQSAIEHAVNARHHH